MFYGIDVSKHQGVVDWKKVKASGKSFAFVRLGWTHYNGGLTIDPFSAANILGAQSAGLDVGIYVYSYDRTPAGAFESARAVIKAIDQYKLTYPIVFDIEDEIEHMPKYDPKDTPEQRSKKLKEKIANNNEIVKSFLNAIESSGYYGMLYTYTNFADNLLNMKDLRKYDLWIADYRRECGYKGNYGIWQYAGDKGRCDGVSTGCDLNISYKDYASIIKKAGLNRLLPPVSTPAPDYEALYKEKCEAYDKLISEYNSVKSDLSNILQKMG